MAYNAMLRRLATERSPFVAQPPSSEDGGNRTVGPLDTGGAVDAREVLAGHDPEAGPTTHSGRG